MVATKELTVRGASPQDRKQIDTIRRLFSDVLLDDPKVLYTVAEQDGKILAMYGVKMDSNSRRALVIDLYGVNAKAWMTLLNHLFQWADRFGIQISGWVSVNNPHIKSFLSRGCYPSAILVRRDPR